MQVTNELKNYISSEVNRLQYEERNKSRMTPKMKKILSKILILDKEGHKLTESLAKECDSSNVRLEGLYWDLINPRNIYISPKITNNVYNKIIVMLQYEKDLDLNAINQLIAKEFQ